ncbi:MAG: 3-oxoacyl-ACP synthase [Hymenobacter sp.]|nr:MAG: 3-oxoacyl-ACP synthase [Hymenobacter sp.]
MHQLSKSALYKACLTYVEQRINQARIGMTIAQEASNTETKSSAGDKYETGRAMAQQERDRHAVQLYEAQQLLDVLQRLSAELLCDTVRLGAVVETDIGLFYVSIGAGKLRTAEGQEFLAVSSVAPVIVALSGRRAGEDIVFNGRVIRVLTVS